MAIRNDDLRSRRRDAQEDSLRRWPWITAVLLWTLPWAIIVLGDVHSSTALGRGATGSGIELYEVMEVLFVAGYGGIRWLAGLTVLAVAAMAVGAYRQRRGSTG